tara:strand:- start:80528 stop:80692 length:165 start_codon:yes stop_codon:yes gene_type:complete
MKLFLKRNMKERCRWSLAILLGMGILSLNREFRIIPTVLEYLKEIVPNRLSFFI